MYIEWRGRSEIRPRRQLDFRDLVLLKVAQQLERLGIKPRALRPIMTAVAQRVRAGGWPKVVAVWPGSQTVIDLAGADEAPPRR